MHAGTTFSYELNSLPGNCCFTQPFLFFNLSIVLCILYNRGKRFLCCPQSSTDSCSVPQCCICYEYVIGSLERTSANILSSLLSVCQQHFGVWWAARSVRSVQEVVKLIIYIFNYAHTYGYSCLLSGIKKVFFSIHRKNFFQNLYFIFQLYYHELYFFK